MAIKYDRETYNKIFSDLETFKEFCASSWVLGYHRAYKFDERDLYNNKSEAWRNFCNFKNGKRPRPNFKKKFNRRH